MTNEKVTFDLDNFERGARAVFVKDGGRVACEVKAAFSIDSKDVLKRYATHSFIEFVEVSLGACWVKKDTSPGCLLMITDARIEGEALREMARCLTVDINAPVFFYAGAKIDMKPLSEKSDVRFNSFLAPICAAAKRLIGTAPCEK